MNEFGASSVTPTEPHAAHFIGDDRRLRYHLVVRHGWQESPAYGWPLIELLRAHRVEHEQLEAQQ